MSEDLELGNQGAGVGILGAEVIGIFLDVFLGVLVKAGFKTVPRKEIQERKCSHGDLGSPARVLNVWGF